MERTVGTSETAHDAKSGNTFRNKRGNTIIRRGFLHGSLAALIVGFSIACDRDQSPVVPKGDGPSVAELMTDINSAEIDREIVRSTDSEIAIFEALNVEREVRGLPRLKMDPELTRLARLRSQHMIDNGYFSLSDVTGNEYYDDLINAACRSSKGWTGENIAANNLSEAEDTVRGWMNARASRNVFLNQNLNSVGIGAIDDEKGIRYVSALYSEYPC